MNRPWVKYLPSSLRSRIEGRWELQEILGNTGWLFGDRACRMAIGLFVGVWVARYLGPMKFGIYSYAVALVSLIGFLGALGLDGIVVRDLVKRPSDGREILGTAFCLKFVGGLAGAAIINLIVALIRPGDELTRGIVAILSTGLVFQSLDAIDFWFQSRVRSRYVVIARNGAFVLASLVKVGLIISGASITAFAWASALEVALGVAGLVLAYRSAGESPRAWRWSLSRASSLLQDSWPLILSGIAIMIYTRIDQIMLGEMLGHEVVGIYSAATRISEIWYFIPVAIASSVSPAITEAKKISEGLYYRRLERVFRLMTLVSLSIVIPMTFLSEAVTRLFYGAGYAGAGRILSVHIWAAVFVFLGVAQGPWTLNEGLMRLSLQRAVFGAAANILLNLVLIPRYGGIGAAVATLVSQSLSSFLLNGCDRRTRRIFSLQLGSFALTRPPSLSGPRDGSLP
jgi:PST family polysaccharide transporter